VLALQADWMTREIESQAHSATELGLIGFALRPACFDLLARAAAEFAPMLAHSTSVQQ
jgi:hypothetical protein